MVSIRRGNQGSTAPAQRSVDRRVCHIGSPEIFMARALSVQPDGFKSGGVCYRFSAHVQDDDALQ